MIFSSCLTDQDRALVLDASVIINLLATGQANSILRALPLPLLVSESVVHEIERGATTGRPESEQLTELITQQALKIEMHSEVSLEHFFELVSGQTSSSLGDGEAATLAIAHDKGFSAGIDERKARRIAADRFQELRVVTTVDILAHESVFRKLGPKSLGTATLLALRIARMQVWEHQFDWIVQLVGKENIANCPSLKKYTRLAMTTARGQSTRHPHE